MKTIIQRINDLANHLDNTGETRDVGFDVIFKLRQAYEVASDSECSKQELSDLILSHKDCLATEKANELPAEMLEEIKNLQHEIVDTFGLQD
ncbi:hypothetical protein [Methylomonas sp. 11b]|uniref:hypothetical protein n=1 Tax=Methylomonas sp. 11b TaxID=1168169 RepID=UPI00047C047F|nr:hypothetical protein [Methylomonas sp. 11b]